MSFVNRFRVVARKFIYFQQRTHKLGPAYQNCNEKQTSCTRRAADPRRGCPNCEWTIQWGHFLKDTEAELSKVKGGTRIGARRWPMKALLESVYQVAGLVSKHEKREGPNWTVVTAMLVSVYRDEKAKKDAIDHYNLTQQIENSRASTNRKPEMGEYD